VIDLESIKDPSFVKKLTKKELLELCQEIRRFLIENVSKTGGHLSSNLGVVELTVALYYVFDLEKDEILFDVGHQSYVHKILTGRAKDFKTLRQYGGMSGYISRSESKYDIWESGHSSTTISAASGLHLSDPSKRQIVIIGDSSISNGVAFEGLNYLGQLKNNTIVILNDNKMGISQSVGALSKTFLRLRSTKFVRGTKYFMQKRFPNFIVKIGHKLKKSIKGLVQKDNFFEDFGFDYYGPYDGNKLNTTIRLLERIKDNKDPVLIHLVTKKGLGYDKAEDDTIGAFHGVEPFNIETGKPLVVEKNKISYSQAVANYLIKKRSEHEFFVITPAMKTGAKLEEFANNYPDSFIDVGIQEEHAAVMSAGIALHKKDVVLLMYSTFAQRAFDEILNDIARSDLKIIFGIDRSGIVGEDGVTHQGLYDLSMFMLMPNIVVTQPKDIQETVGLFNYAFTQPHPIVIRYPKEKELLDRDIDYNYICNLNWTIINDGNKLSVISYGTDVERLKKIVKDNNLDVCVINARSIKPVDYNMLDKIFNFKTPIIVFEQVISSGTLYQKILEYKELKGYTNKVYSHSFTPDTLISHGKRDDVFKAYGFSDSNFLEKIRSIYDKES